MAKNKITLDVLADITRKGNIGSNTSPRGNISLNNRKEALVVFTGSNINLNNRIQELKELDVNLSLAFSFMAEKILNIDDIINKLNPTEVYREEDILDLEALVEDYSYIIGPNITINTLSKVSLGMVDSLISNLIWTFLYKGKNVYLDFTSVNNYLGYSTENREINKIINNHINTIKDMGVREISKDKYLDKIVNNTNNSNSQNSRFLNRKTRTNSNIRVNNNHNREGYSHNNNNKIDNKGSKIITENDFINNYLDQKSISFPKGTIITPLARDKARELRIEISIDR